MTAPRFTYGVLIALLLAIAAATGIPVLVDILGIQDGVRLAVALCAGSYLLSLIRLDQDTSGLVTAALLWLGAALLLGVFVVDFAAYVVAHTALIWLIRALLLRRGAGYALADALVSGLAIAAAAIALSRTGSAFLSVWCFFFVQAAIAYLPELTSGVSTSRRHDPSGAFLRAERQAESALEILIND